MRELRMRGWSSGMVKRHLGNEDAVDTQVQFPKRPRRLWAVHRVYEEEIQPNFIQVMEVKRQYANRAFAARSGSEKAALHAARTVHISLEHLPPEYATRVRAIAAQHDVLVFEDSDGLPLGWECLAVEHLLEALNPHFYGLDDFVGKPGVRNARVLLLKRLLSAIASKYPELNAECSRRIKLQPS